MDWGTWKAKLIYVVSGTLTKLFSTYYVIAVLKCLKSRRRIGNPVKRTLRIGVVDIAYFHSYVARNLTIWKHLSSSHVVTCVTYFTNLVLAHSMCQIPSLSGLYWLLWETFSWPWSGGFAGPLQTVHSWWFNCHPEQVLHKIVRKWRNHTFPLSTTLPSGK